MAISKQVYMITGASRGLGQEMVRQLLHEDGMQVIAAARKPNEGALKELKTKHGDDKLRLVQLDVCDPASIKAAAEIISREVGQLDVLVNNAGISDQSTISWAEMDHEEAVQVFKANVLGPAAVTAALLPVMRKAGRKVIVNITSYMGSLTVKHNQVKAEVQTSVSATQAGQKRQPGAGEIGVMYCATKSALNMETLFMAKQLAAEGFTVFPLHPGWCKTDMGHHYGNHFGIEPPVDPQDSAKGMLQVIQNAQPSDSGTFFVYDGSTLPW